MTRTLPIEIRDACPYCEHKFSIDARDINGELHALRCLDCKEKFVVEIIVDVRHTIDGIAGVDADKVLDRLSGVVPRKAESGDLFPDPELTDPDSLATSAGVLEQIESELEAGEGIPVLTDVVLGPDELEDRSGARSAFTRECDDGVLLSDDELEELRELVAIDAPGTGVELEDRPPDFEEAEPFEHCHGCYTRTYCRNAGRCTREKPATAHSGINTRPPSMGSLGKPAPGKYGALRLRDKR